MSKDIISKIQTYLKVTKGELFVSFILLFGLTIGLIAKVWLNSDNEITQNDINIEKLLDSIAVAESMNYVGTDYDNNPIEEVRDDEFAEEDHTIKEEKPTFFKDKSELEDKVTTQKEEVLLVNINTASRVELMRLPGIGEKTAEKIIKYRENTPFYKIEDIMKIKGIGEKKFEKMSKFITI